MLIKEADDQTLAMEELEKLAAGNGAEAKQAAVELRNRKAGLKGEAESAYLINFDYGDSPNWAVIHDLRLEHGGRSAQIDHLLVNRWMEFFVLETKRFHAGVKITEEGEFLRWNDFSKRYEGMPSPLQQNERHIAVLSDIVGTIELPSRFGIRIPPTFNSLVLVGSSARIDRPERFDTSRVIKSDQLKPRIWRDLALENPVSVLFKAATRMVSGETVRFVAEQLVARHQGKVNVRAADKAAEGEVLPASVSRPQGGQAAVAVNEPDDGTVVRPREPIPAAVGPADRASTPIPSCKACQSGRGGILHGKYGYYFKCGDCGANTAVRFTCQPGHHPRARKDGANFYRDCAECGTSELFYRNEEAGTGA